MTSILKKLRTQPNGNYDAAAVDSAPVVAPSGFTASAMTFPTSIQVEITHNIELLSGLIPATSNFTQRLVPSGVTIPSGVVAPGRLSIAPVSGANESTMLRTLEDTTTESLSADNGALADISQFIFSSFTIGDEDLVLGGTIPVNQDGATSVIGQTTNTADETAELDLGYWSVLVDLPATMEDYPKFILPAGTTPPSSGFITKTTEKVVDFADFVNEQGKLLLEYVVDPRLISIVENITLSSVKFLAGSTLPEGTKVYVDDFVAGTTVIGTTSTITYAVGKFPYFPITLYRGTKIESTFQLGAGSYLPPSTFIEPASTTTGEWSVGTTRPLVLSNVSAASHSLVFGGVGLTGVSLIAKRFVVPKGYTTSYFQPAIACMRTTDELNLEQVLFPSDTETECYIRLLEDYQTSEDNQIILQKGSLVKSGSSMSANAPSMTGALINQSIQLTSGSLVTKDVDIKSEITLSADAVLHAGAVLHAPFEFPARSRFYEGNLLPDHLKIMIQMGVTLALGMVLPVATHLGSLFNLCDNVGFAKNYVFPALSTLVGQFIFPVGTQFENGTVLPVQIPIPVSTRFSTNDILPSGMTFQHDSVLPSIPDILSQATVAGGTSSLRKTSDGLYLIISKGTAFIAGSRLPVGTVLSSVADQTLTHNEAISGNYSTVLTLAAGTYSSDSSIKAPSAIDLDITPGVAITELIVLLCDLVVPSDILIPAESVMDGLMSYLSFNSSFTLVKDLVLSSPYTVRQSNSVLWPANVPTHSNFVLTAPFTINGPVQLVKKIVLNVSTDDDFVHDIMTTGSVLKMPPAGCRLESPVKLAVNQPVAGVGTFATKSTVELPAGTKLSLAGTNSYITITQAMKVVNDFTVMSDDFTLVQRIFLENGLKLLKGQTLPGDITIAPGTHLPSNIAVSQRFTLGADCVLSDVDYNVPAYSILKKGSVIAIGSQFGSAVLFSSPVTLGPINSLSSENVFYFLEDTELSTDIQLPYLFTNTGFISNLVVDDRRALVKLSQLKDQLDSLEQLLARR